MADIEDADGGFQASILDLVRKSREPMTFTWAPPGIGRGFTLLDQSGSMDDPNIAKFAGNFTKVMEQYKDVPDQVVVFDSKDYK